MLAVTTVKTTAAVMWLDLPGSAGSGARVIMTSLLWLSDRLGLVGKCRCACLARNSCCAGGAGEGRRNRGRQLLVPYECQLSAGTIRPSGRMVLLVQICPPTLEAGD